MLNVILITCPADDAQVESGGIHRPGVDLGEAMAGRESHGIVDVRVVPHLDSDRKSVV